MIRIVFAGTPVFARTSLATLLANDNIQVVGVVSQPDRRSGRGMRTTASPVKKLALSSDIPVITPEKLRNNPEAEAWLKSLNADVLVVVAFGMLLPPVWLQACQVGAINVHASLLPRWRGAAPLERAMLAGDIQTGVCLMQMDKGLDTGAVFVQEVIDITSDTTGSNLHDKLAIIGANMLNKYLSDIVSGKLVAKDQADSGITYAHKLDNQSRNICWQNDAASVARQVQTFAPKPGARTRLDNRWIKIISGYQVLDDNHEELRSKLAGQQIMVDNALHIACGSGVYCITHLQAEGKKAMAASDFLRGIQQLPLRFK
ncbi:MAG: methionyl-tRNA formyltransferase [Mariprofundales bacterium]